MLKKFSVENFKNFKNKIVFDLSASDEYTFNTDAIYDGCIATGIVYGPNGSGKSNLGLAIFDIVLHLTDKEKLSHKYNLYTNLESQKRYASFEYTFSFYNKELVYQYQKKDCNTLLSERISIDGIEVLNYDFVKQKGYTSLKGTETLNLMASSQISRVKFIKSNAILEQNEENDIFNAFLDFIDRMLLFYSLDDRGYQGFHVGSGSIYQGIIDSGKIGEFEQFLRDQGINYKLVSRKVDEKNVLYCKFGNREVELFSISSTGTASLALFYYWYIKMQDTSFVFIDEFDAFYHFELAEALVKLLRLLHKTQIILTTHNTDLMSNDLLRPDCYFSLVDGKIATISTLTEKDLRQAHNLQRMYKAGAFNVK